MNKSYICWIFKQFFRHSMFLLHIFKCTTWPFVCCCHGVIFAPGLCLMLHLSVHVCMASLQISKLHFFLFFLSQIWMLSPCNKCRGLILTHSNSFSIHDYFVSLLIFFFSWRQRQIDENCNHCMCVFVYGCACVCICTDIHIFVSQQAVGD